MQPIRNTRIADYLPLAIAAALITLPGCTVAGDIFKAGVWAAVIGIGLLVVIGYGISTLFRR
jgi:hypothetical protein